MSNRLQLPTFTILLLFLAALPFTLASAAAQFKLNVNTQASNCWMECNKAVVEGKQILPHGDIDTSLYIKENCKLDTYLTLMPLCLAQECPSAPDAAYAIEFGKSWCKKAGFDIDIALPDSYVQAASEYFTSPAYTSRGTRGIKNWGLGDIILFLAPGAALLVV